jgi:uncharacterized integral membrane protein
MTTPDHDSRNPAQPGPATGPPSAPNAPGTPTAPVEPAAPATAPAASHAPAKTRLGSLWVILVSGAAVLVLLLVFILQNLQHVQVHIFGAHLNAPLGVALLLAAALGVLLVVVPGAGRIIQLRRSARRAHLRADALEQAMPDATGQRPGQ